MIETTQPRQVDADNSIQGVQNRVAPSKPESRVSSGISTQQSSAPVTVVADLHVGVKGTPAAHAKGPLVPASAFVGPDGVTSGGGAPATKRPSTLLEALEDFDRSFKGPGDAKDRAAKLTNLLYFATHRKTEVDKVATGQIVRNVMSSIVQHGGTVPLLEAIEALDVGQANVAALPLVQAIGILPGEDERKLYAGALVITLNRLLADPSSDQATVGRAVSQAAGYTGQETVVNREIASLSSEKLDAYSRATVLKYVVREGTPRTMQSLVNKLQHHRELVPGIIAQLDDPKEALIVLRRLATAVDQNHGPHRVELAKAIRVSCIKYAATLVDPSLQGPFKRLGEKLESDLK
ncbi:hypothetical protein XH83_13160 [Bradyrhizobium sp. CCBAU 53351]|uniref:hypothetical protein n=1 Tax=Bradyrhizobium sp. CCBAU 53351 TaxID=1325114 RepID=UPI001889906D|nr:hypothetical protein [Bradyrhizobium sp. CCBAU 53351]QOZ76311.1 hypothetical protein XH83_13160 [Bradyrhizobium sp. CCBAU 53351]